MRNLKKFLALVLAMMMIFSLMVSVNAADYTDASQVNSTYKEAVDVTDALDIFRGRDGNTFQPQSNMRRDEFATVLYRLATGDVHDEHLDDWRGIVAFADIPADNWAAPYVAYAYSAKLMQGDGTNFHPTLPINGYDCALALLRLLGYGKKDEYTGNYQLNVAIDGARIGLTNVVGTRNLNGYATREIIAELAYDALSCDMVYYDHDRDSYYQNDSREDSAKLGAVIFDMEVIRQGQPKNANNPQGASWNLMTDFKLTPDVFFRPNPEYVVLSKGDVIYEGRPSAVATYNGNFTGADAQPYLTAYAAATATVTLYYNGALVGDPMGVNGDNSSLPTFTKSTAGNIGLWIDDDTGIPGYEIEIYDVTPDNATVAQYRVIVREAALAEVGETNESTGEIDLNPQLYPAIPAVRIDGTVSTIRSTSGTPVAIPKTASTYAALAAHEEDDLVAVYFRGGSQPSLPSDVLEVAELQGIETTINHIDRNTWKYTDTNGTVYQRAKDTYFPVSGGYSDDYGTTGDTYLYLLNGYIMYREPISATATTGYAYLADVREDNQGWEIEDGGKIYMARLYLSDGSVVEVRATDFKEDKTNSIAATSVLASFNATKTGQLVWYSVNSRGVYTVRGINSYTVPTTAGLEVKKGQADGMVYTSAGNTAVVYDSKTVFFVVNRSTSTGAVISVVPYEGIANVPTTTAAAGSTVVAAAKAYDPANGISTGVNANGSGRVTAVMIANPVSSTVNNYFIVGTTNAQKITEGTGSNKVEYYVYNAVVGGTITTVKVGAGSNQPANPNGLNAQAYYYSSVIESGGVITAFGGMGEDLSTGNVSKGVYQLSGTSITRVSSTVIKIGSGTDPAGNVGNYVTSSLKAYFYNPTTGVIRAADLSKVGGELGGYTGYMVIDRSSGIDVLTELYLVNSNI